ncbi:MAG TPA: molybdopterin cofactor-binding domain-containing protein, partial [Candidatus Saccharimonadales bacterium]|nr:molybdopterin cofactor-binding domain-containing protein [Candidatus Saccharimonadales bacterium]
STCRAGDGAVSHPASDRKLLYGELVAKAASLDVPQEPRLKDPADFTILGRPTLRLDTPDKVRGRAIFGLDFRLPGMVYAAVARPEIPGASMRSFSDGRASKVPGVKRVMQVGPSVVVVGTNTWAALEGRRRLDVEWELGPNATLDTAGIEAQWRKAAEGTALRAWEEGSTVAAFKVAAKKLEADYELPFLAHAPMEPTNCTADVKPDRCEVWAPTQVPNSVRATAAEITGLPRDKVTVHVTLMGGAFGRRLMDDDAADAVRISKAIGGPVKVVFSREDEMRHDWYRPGSRHHLTAGLDDEGRLMAWTHRVVTPSIGAQQGYVPEGSLDEGAVSGAVGLPYAIPNIWVDFAMSNTPVPLGYWRSVYDSQTAFANECFLDEVAHAAGKDPLELRRDLLKGSPRHLAVLNLAAEKAGWGSPLPKGRGRGLAVHYSFQSYVAHVAEVSVSGEGEIRVHKVVSAVDCGRALNPLTLKAQLEGGVVFGLSAVLFDAITVEKGRVVQGNFDDYPLLKMSQMPVVETWIVPSEESPTGAGEPPVPPLMPAVANAVFAATGKRIRKLPLTPERVRA